MRGEQINNNSLRKSGRSRTLLGFSECFLHAVINAQMAIILFLKRCLNLGEPSEAVSLKKIEFIWPKHHYLLPLSYSLSLSFFLSHVHPYKRASTNTLSLPLSLSLSFRSATLDILTYRKRFRVVNSKREGSTNTTKLLLLFSFILSKKLGTNLKERERETVT